MGFFDILKPKPKVPIMVDVGKITVRVTFHNPKNDGQDAFLKRTFRGKLLWLPTSRGGIRFPRVYTADELLKSWMRLRHEAGYIKVVDDGYVPWHHVKLITVVKREEHVIESGRYKRVTT
jgi:hypothetical protein